MIAALMRPGVETDAAAAARLHAANITEGFLSSLGVPFLTRLYRRVVRDPRSILLVAEVDGEPVGFAAGTADVGRLYKTFLARDGLAAGLVAAPRLLRSWRRVLETLRYPTGPMDLPPAEVLAVAVAPAGRGAGTGRLLVEGLTAGLAELGVDAARVVAASDNAPAIGLYRGCGFHVAGELEVHPGTTSTVLVWP